MMTSRGMVIREGKYGFRLEAKARMELISFEKEKKIVVEMKM